MYAIFRDVKFFFLLWFSMRGNFALRREHLVLSGDIFVFKDWGNDCAADTEQVEIDILNILDRADKHTKNLVQNFSRAIFEKH